MLLSSRTPLRVSFFGGGTDYPDYFQRHPGAVVGMAIDRYIYISALRLTDIIDYKYRVSYSKLERVKAHSEIEHPVIREVLGHYRIEDALDISIQSDLPASSGMGSSSAFTVGLINLASALRKQSMTRLDLSQAAIHVEQNLLKENVGVQDQLHAAFGGMNRFDFVNGRIQITPVNMSEECLNYLLSSLVLVYTRRTRFSSEVAVHQVTATREGKIDNELSHLLALVSQAVDVLEMNDPEQMIGEFGAMMKEGWQTKRKLSIGITTTDIDDLYDAALKAGALGGKLCGAGGGGFLLMVVRPEMRKRFEQALHGLSLIPVGMDRHGSTILKG
ncbi:MAG: GHMP kinase [Alphaproteobacteria bacterium]|nr:GHMP kinase [Alphaproteobacteria bacterium]